MIGKTYVEISQDNKDVKYKDLALENLSECSKLFPENSDADFLLSELFDYSKEKKHQKIERVGSCNGKNECNDR